MFIVHLEVRDYFLQFEESKTSDIGKKLLLSEMSKLMVDGDVSEVLG